MCHTELAPKKKCNSPSWRHMKLFQIYLWAGRPCADQQPPVSGSKAGSRAAWMLQFGWSMVTAHSTFLVKNCVPSTCSSEEFFSNTSQNHNLTWLQTSAKWLLMSQAVTLVSVAMNGEEQPPFFWPTRDAMSKKEKNQSLSVCFPLTVKEG